MDVYFITLEFSVYVHTAYTEICKGDFTESKSERVFMVYFLLINHLVEILFLNPLLLFED